MAAPLTSDALDTLFLSARSYNDWEQVPFGHAEIDALYELTKFGPTAGNSSPARFYWLLSAESRERLLPHLWEPNREKTSKASVTVIIATDYTFPDYLAKLLPVVPEEMARGFFAGPGVLRTAGFRNSSMQGAYLTMAARALGWDVGAMSGFEHAGVDAEFFAGTQTESNYILNMGRGTQVGLHRRLPRLDLHEAGTIL